MDKLHIAYMERQFDLLATEGANVNELRRNQPIYTISRKRVTKIGCARRGCKLWINVAELEQPNGERYYTFNGTIFERRHCFPFH